MTATPSPWRQRSSTTLIVLTFVLAIASGPTLYVSSVIDDEDAFVFLINHWLTTGIPVKEAAEVVNSPGSLLDRVRTCEAELGRLPTVLATDFVQTGDLIEVVAELNGVTR